ncbi:Ctr copper transporter family-domain-containing protein [Naematelia encephala]|uniref:Copper transport protein n=1 Tax=Naematelia encephala TaxID=71784 RepID=A0A1Y2AIW6_9TREE|nr:Ctr copper transporter family-domain-containing protein [Naematelia encephala]
MSSMVMSMATTATATAAASAASASSTSMGDMGDMDTGMGSCTISMLWNWNTVGSCFLAESWYIRNKADFAGTIIGIFLLCMSIELVRRIGREYDRRLTFQSAAKVKASESDSPSMVTLPVPWGQQIVRGFLYGTQFFGAFLVMLLGMYFNGFVLLAIFLGQTTGYILFARDTATINGSTDSGCCC